MANKKNKKNKKQVKSVKKLNREATVVILMVVGILSAVLVYLKSGIFGENLSNFLGGIVGIVKYIIPIGIIAISINMIHNNKSYITSKLIQYGIILCCMSTVLSIYEIATNKSLIITENFQSVIDRAYYLGTIGKGGGIIGACIAIPLIKLLGVPGTIILAIGLALIFVVLMFDFKPTILIENMLKKMKEDGAQYKQIRENNEQKIIGSKKEKRLREKEEKLKQAEEVSQLQINFGEDDTDMKKYKHDSDDIVPLGMENKIKNNANYDPEYIEGNLFKQEEKKKEDSKKEVLQLEHAVVVEDEHYEYPPFNLLSKSTKKTNKAGAKALTDTAARLQKTLYSFGVSAKVEDVSVGPAITRYELKPAEGVRVSKIANLADDIALNLAAETIRIEAPIPGKQAVRNRSSK